jgi:hypothetical protein
MEDGGFLVIGKLHLLTAAEAERMNEAGASIGEEESVVLVPRASHPGRRQAAENFGAPHSSVMMWLSRWHSTLPQGGVRAARLRALAADPVETGRTSTSRSKISAKRARAPAVKLVGAVGRILAGGRGGGGWTIWPGDGLVPVLVRHA